MNDTMFTKAWGCLAGLAIGDAMGMPVEGLTAQEIRRRYDRLTTFEAPMPPHPHESLPRATVTDDTEHALLIANVFIRHGAVTVDGVAQALIEWVRERDGFSLSILGPSTREALRLLLRGVDPHTAGANGKTDGAAMRVAAVGIIHAGDLDRAIRDAATASVPTHGTSVAISGATAVAAAVAEAMRPDAQMASVIRAAVVGAQTGAARGILVPSASVASRIELACRLAGQGSAQDAPQVLAEQIGVDMFPTEAVPTAIGLLTAHDGAPMPAIIDAVNIGGDTDTIAAIAGAIGGALQGITAFPKEMVEEVEAVNRLHLPKIAQALTARAPALNVDAAGD